MKSVRGGGRGIRSRQARKKGKRSDLRTDFLRGCPRRVFDRRGLRRSNRSWTFLDRERFSGNHCATNNANDQINRESYHCNIQRTENSRVEQRSGEGAVCSVRDHRHGEPGTDSGKQPHDERLLSEPASVKAQKERGQ